jgi:heterodisulfide reductase subunit A-like polyferredoxin
MSREPNIVTTIKVRRLESAGHLVRISDDRTIKKVFLVKPDGRRKAERPKLRLLHCNKNYLKLKGVKRWGIKANDRSVWAVILKEALVRL